MAKSTQTKSAQRTALDGMSMEDLHGLIDSRIAGGEIPWPLNSWGLPWPIWPPFPPFPPVGPLPSPPCPVCGANTHPGLARAMVAAQGFQPMARVAGAPAKAEGRQTLTTGKIWRELQEALGRWKPRLEGLDKDTELASMSASGGGRFDVLSAVNVSPFFKGLGLFLHYFQIGGDDTLGEVSDTIARLLEDLGHRVTT